MSKETKSPKSPKVAKVVKGPQMKLGQSAIETAKSKPGAAPVKARKALKGTAEQNQAAAAKAGMSVAEYAALPIADAKVKRNAPGHYTEKGTRKFQCNGPTDWSEAFKAFAGEGAREGEGIRYALAYAVANRVEVLKFSAAARKASGN